MKTAHVVMLAALTAVTTAAFAFPGSTDEARAEYGQRLVAAEHAASLRPFVPNDTEVVRVTDTDSARKAAGQANARLSHDLHLAEVSRAGAGIKPAPIQVTDSDSARAAAGQRVHEQALLADYADYVKLQAQTTTGTNDTSKQ